MISVVTEAVTDNHTGKDLAPAAEDGTRTHRVTVEMTHVHQSEAITAEVTVGHISHETGIETITTDIRTEDTSEADHALPDAVRRRSRIADALHHLPFQLKTLKPNWISSHARSKR